MKGLPDSGCNKGLEAGREGEGETSSRPGCPGGDSPHSPLLLDPSHPSVPMGTGRRYGTETHGCGMDVSSMRMRAGTGGGRSQLVFLPWRKEVDMHGERERGRVG